MNAEHRWSGRKIEIVLMMLAVAAWGAPAGAAVFNLRAEATTITLPGGLKVGMWGFALDSSFGAGDGRVTIPGPALILPPGDGTLTLRLKNNLTQAKTGVPGGVVMSLIVPALPGALKPVYWGATHPQYAGRVRSLNKETAPGNTTPVDYTWTGVRPGTFLYQSATQMQVQVQMGLYGAVKKDFTQGQAYAGVPYDQETMLFYSEIDPALHQAVVSGNYGPGKAVTSTMGYHSRWFMVNGVPFTQGSAALHQAVRGRRLLIRMLNAGLQTHVPMVNGLYWSLVAEDANPYPGPHVQYTANLTAGKTLDAVISPDAAGRYPVFDRTLSLTNDLAGPGGLLSYINVAPNSGAAPTATPETYAANESTSLAVPVATGVLKNDVNPTAGTALVARLAAPPGHGSLALNGDGSFTYKPGTGWYGKDQFTYLCSNGLADSAPAAVTINVAFVDNAPVTTAKHFTTKKDTLLSILPPGVLTGDYDPEGKPLKATLASPPTSGTVNSLSTEGSMDYMPAAGYLGNVSFKYVAGDGAVNSVPTTVTIKIAAANAVPAPKPDSYTIKRNTVLTVPGSGVLANDVDADGDTLMAFVSGLPASGTLQLDAKGSFKYTPNPGFAGKDSFEYWAYDGQLAERATVAITINP